mmetsp:Transcript_77410/g.139684  ORF Transcript_77410/g.139684 Transcript_77410/m.139684 type:complete len:208 (+) Transcript_77410:387-1010(+)
MRRAVARRTASILVPLVQGLLRVFETRSCIDLLEISRILTIASGHQPPDGAIAAVARSGVVAPWRSCCWRVVPHECIQAIAALREFACIQQGSQAASRAIGCTRLCHPFDGINRTFANIAVTVRINRGLIGDDPNHFGIRPCPLVIDWPYHCLHIHLHEGTWLCIEAHLQLLHARGSPDRHSGDAHAAHRYTWSQLLPQGFSCIIHD